jgi:hypothetical protein
VGFVCFVVKISFRFPIPCSCTAGIIVQKGLTKSTKKLIIDLCVSLVSFVLIV